MTSQMWSKGIALLSKSYMEVDGQSRASSALPRERDTVFILQKSGVGLGAGLEGWEKLRPNRGSNHVPPSP